MRYPGYIVSQGGFETFVHASNYKVETGSGVMLLTLRLGRKVVAFFHGVELGIISLEDEYQKEKEGEKF